MATRQTKELIACRALTLALVDLAALVVSPDSMRPARGCYAFRGVAFVGEMVVVVGFLLATRMLVNGRRVVVFSTPPVTIVVVMAAAR